jgi:hypothetical protein
MERFETPVVEVTETRSSERRRRRGRGRRPASTSWGSRDGPVLVFVDHDRGNVDATRAARPSRSRATLPDASVAAVVVG